MSAAVAPLRFVIPVSPAGAPGPAGQRGWVLRAEGQGRCRAPRPGHPRDGQVRGPGMFPASALLPWLSLGFPGFPWVPGGGAGPAVPSVPGAESGFGSGTGGPSQGWVWCSYLGSLWNRQAFSRKKMASTECSRKRACVEQQGPAGRMSAFLGEAGGCQSDLLLISGSDLGVTRRG